MASLEHYGSDHYREYGPVASRRERDEDGNVDTFWDEDEPDDGDEDDDGLSCDVCGVGGLEGSESYHCTHCGTLTCFQCCCDCYVDGDDDDEANDD